jgi:hypothetical protein
MEETTVKYHGTPEEHRRGFSRADLGQKNKKGHLAVPSTMYKDELKRLWVSAKNLEDVQPAIRDYEDRILRQDPEGERESKMTRVSNLFASTILAPPRYASTMLALRQRSRYANHPFNGF